MRPAGKEKAMSLAIYYNSQFTIAQYVDFCLRILLAFIAGGLIGAERSRRFKEAGIRTHIIVCVTTSLIMLISKYGFADLTWGPGIEYFATRGADAARVAAQAVSGISFLCAGVIFKVGTSVRGLTTAAGIWLTAGIGLAIGAGMYIVSFFTLIVLFLLQPILRSFPIGTDMFEGNHLQFVVKDELDFDTDLRSQLIAWKAHVTESKVTRNNDGTFLYDLVVRREKELTYAEIREFVEGQGDIILSVSNNSIYHH